MRHSSDPERSRQRMFPDGVRKPSLVAAPPPLAEAPRANEQSKTAAPRTDLRNISSFSSQIRAR